MQATTNQRTASTSSTMGPKHDKPKAPPGRDDVTIVVTPTAVDVMCGTGHEKHHAGNDLFKRIVSQFIDPYADASTKKDKMQITKTILDLLTQRGIRFLKKEAQSDSWYVAEPKVARDKVGHFLRLHAPKNYGGQQPMPNPPCSSPFSLGHQKEGFETMSAPRATPLSSFLGDGHEPTPVSATGIHNALENGQVSSIWNTIMDDTINNHQNKSGGGYDYSRSTSEHRPLHQTTPSLSYQSPVLYHQGSSSSASSAPAASHSKIKSQPLFAAKAPSAVLSNAAHYNLNHHQDALIKKGIVTQHAPCFQKNKLDEGIFRLSKESPFNYNYKSHQNHNNDASFEESLPNLDLWGGGSPMMPIAGSHPDGWSRLSWSSCGTIGNKSTDNMADSVHSMEDDLFDDCDLAMRLD